MSNQGMTESQKGRLVWLLSGGAAGLSRVLIGHPFDTLKVPKIKIY